MEGAGRRRIYLMRHGHVDYFDPDIEDLTSVDLTDVGREQAQAAGAALENIDFDIAVCSGLPRTRQTGEIVLNGRTRPSLSVEPGLAELQSGKIEAESREEIAARLAFCFDDAQEKNARFLLDGERFADAEQRIVSAIERLYQDHLWKTALVVAHEGVNRIILGWICGGGLRTVDAFEQDLGCLNVIDIDLTPSEDGAGLHLERAILKAVNVTPYDYVKHGLPRTSLEHLFDIDFGGIRPRKP